MNQFQLGEGVDNTGVTTKFLTCNCSINLLVNIKSSVYGLHINPVVSSLSFNNIPFATSMVSSFLQDWLSKIKQPQLNCKRFGKHHFQETRALYASSNGPTSFLLYVGTTNKPMYSAGRSMQDILDSGNGLSLVVHVKLRSRFHVVGKLFRPKYHHRAECILILNRTYDKQQKIKMHVNQCSLL